MQFPPLTWHHDGRPSLAELVTWIDAEDSHDQPPRAKKRVDPLGRVGLLAPDLSRHRGDVVAASRQAHDDADLSPRLDATGGRVSTLITNDAHDGFLYFPQAAFIFTPFNALPFIAGEILWRACTFGLFVYALVRLGRPFFRRENLLTRASTFLFLSLLAVPSAFASLRNAQFDLPLAALVVLTAAEVAAARWNAAALWLCLAVALKPLAVVPLLLFGALYWRLVPRIVVGLVIVVALPFLHWSPSFVAQEYRPLLPNACLGRAGR